jgi:hypothetical protein
VGGASHAGSAAAMPLPHRAAEACLHVSPSTRGPTVVCRGMWGTLLLLALRRSAKVSRAPCARGQCAGQVENRESKVGGTSPWWPFACGYLELRPMSWRCCAARRRCRWQYATPGALQQLSRASSMRVPADINVLGVFSARCIHPPRAPEPASPSHAAPRQRSCANGGRTRVPCNQTRLQWPGQAAVHVSRLVG